VYTTKRTHEQDGLLVVATPAYQTAYQSVRPGPITQVLRRTLATLSAAVTGGRILADTEEVTGSNPVSPTKESPSHKHFPESFSRHRATYAQQVRAYNQTVGPAGRSLLRLLDQVDRRLNDEPD
jgi:hypothetical protein